MLVLLILLDICLRGRSQTSTVYFKSGNNATLVCPASTSAEIIEWKKNNEIISDFNKINPEILNYEKYTVVSNESNRYMLHIQMANEDEVGEYWCETTIDTEFKTWSFRLVEIEMPTQLKIINTVSKNLVHGQENISIDLTCTIISGKPKETLSWIFNNTAQVSDNSSDRLIHMILPDRKFNNRRYTCQADNGYLDSPLQTSVILDMDYVPNVSIIVTPNSTVNEGTKVTFGCIHDVKSAAVIKWFKNGYPFQSFKSKLQYVDNIDRSDAGVYSCRVVGNRQYDSENVSLTILYSPDVFVINYNNGTLFCNASGNPDEYNYSQWEHSSSKNNHIRYINGSKDGNLHITGLDSQTWFYYSGIYTCSAENGVIRNAMRYQSGFQHIELKGSPQCLQNPITEHGIQRQSAKLFFELHSSPKYTSFQWKTLTYTISNMSRKYDTTVTGTYLKTVLYNNVSFQVAVWKFSLIIYNIDQEDFNIYTIQVANKIGNTSCSVRFKPSNVRDMKNMLYFGILILSVILLFTSVISNICIHKHCKKLSRVRLQTGNNEVSGVNIEMTNINNEYHTINEEDIRQEDNEVQNQAELHNTYDSSSHDSGDKSDESATNESELRESNDYLNPYCTMIQSTSDVHNYISLSLEKLELSTSIAEVDLNTGIQRSYENLKF